MTLTKWRASDLDHLTKSLIGYERMFDVFDTLVTEKTTFPHHNIAKPEDNKYVVELAVAGFTQDDIDIELENGTLHIRGQKEDRSEVDYIFKGIATRSFHKTIQLADTIEVRGAELEHGILKVYLENVIPEEKKPKKIAIGNVAAKQQLLTE